MAASSLLVLLDDIATLLDDVASMTKAAAAKTAGVLGDDLAVNAEQVRGVQASRELPVVWAVAKGSLANKAILVPAALLISWLAPWLILPVLMLGGTFLCFEACEKLAHQFFAHSSASAGGESAAGPAAESSAIAEFERRRIQGAIRTDFILSGEIVVITLGIIADAPLAQKALVLSGIAVLMTFAVYGTVAAIVKLDDLGFNLQRSAVAVLRSFGDLLVRAAPWLMRSLAVLGTIAMFLVGGGILLHGWPVASAAVAGMASGLPALVAGALSLAASIGLGIVAGTLALAAVRLFSRAVRRKAVADNS